ncbi:hypothetical protein HRbin33_02509 [bacterium HR33]|nr:hypothetical protein HRbin33_02509 [bacterium HR33]
MFFVIAGTVLAALGAGAIYLLHEKLGFAGAAMAGLRTAGVAALLLLVVNPARLVRSGDAAPTVLLDASLSMGASGGRWQEALDTARSRAGQSGVIWRFGSRVEELRQEAPADGRTLLREALVAARGRGGPVVVVTDGEIEDAGLLDRSLLEGVEVILLPRNRLPDAALVEVALPERVGTSDSVKLDLALEFYGPLPSDTGRIEVLLGERRLATRRIAIPEGGGLIRRSLVLGPGTLPPGTQLIGVSVGVPGDSEPRNNVRRKFLTVTAEPAIAVVASPAGWESRFFVRELRQMVEAPIRAFAEIQADRWVDMLTQEHVLTSEVRRVLDAASLVVSFGRASRLVGSGRAHWRWLDPSAEASAFSGEWYVSENVPSSPLAGRLAGLRWDSVPPLTGLVALAPEGAAWVALSARLGRRGAERGVLVGRDSPGSRTLVTAAGGLWRWAFRGGASREAYRTTVAAGIDWLLGAAAVSGASRLAATSAVEQGNPVVFEWRGPAVPDSFAVEFSGDSTGRAVLHFDVGGTATLQLPPGVYRWRALASAGFPGDSGRVVVEEYSSEFRHRPITLVPQSGSGVSLSQLRHLRERLWMFAVVVLVLAAEWVWRYRSGLP